MSRHGAKRIDLTRVRKIAAEVLGVGKNKVWMDPEEREELAMGKSVEKVQKMVDDGLILARPMRYPSRGRTRQYRLEKAKGRHRGPGKRSGTRNARLPEREVWMQRIRSLRRLLKELRATGRIDRTAYRALYLKAKGNCFKSKRTLLEHVTAEELRRKREEMVLSRTGGMAGG
jgi:large subunit ribosomal protein L19e